MTKKWPEARRRLRIAEEHFWRNVLHIDRAMEEHASPRVSREVESLRAASATLYKLLSDVSPGAAMALRAAARLTADEAVPLALLDDPFPLALLRRAADKAKSIVRCHPMHRRRGRPSDHRALGGYLKELASIYAELTGKSPAAYWSDRRDAYHGRFYKFSERCVARLMARPDWSASQGRHRPNVGKLAVAAVKAFKKDRKSHA